MPCFLSLWPDQTCDPQENIKQHRWRKGQSRKHRGQRVLAFGERDPRRDVTLKEDATRMTVGNAGKVMASINNLVLALIRQAKFHNAAQARRWFAGHVSNAFTLLTTPFSRL